MEQKKTNLILLIMLQNRAKENYFKLTNHAIKIGQKNATLSFLYMLFMPSYVHIN